MDFAYLYNIQYTIRRCKLSSKLQIFQIHQINQNDSPNLLGAMFFRDRGSIFLSDPSLAKAAAKPGTQGRKLKERPCQIVFFHPSYSSLQAKVFSPKELLYLKIVPLCCFPYLCKISRLMFFFF